MKRRECDWNVSIYQRNVYTKQNRATKKKKNIIKTRHCEDIYAHTLFFLMFMKYYLTIIKVDYSKITRILLDGIFFFIQQSGH